MPRYDPAKAIAVLDAMLEFFAGGKRWTRGKMVTYDGRNRCLVGALQHIRAELGIRGDNTVALLESALRQHHPNLLYYLFKPSHDYRPRYDFQKLRRLMWFNDRCQRYQQVRAVIVKARAAAEAELNAKRERTGTVTQRSVTARCDSPAPAHQDA
jgi:hypothetical protein